MPVALRFLLSLLLFLCLSSSLAAQDKVTLSGTLRDASTGEPLIGANVGILGTASGVITNTNGFYSLTTVPGSYRIQFSYLGYQSQINELSLTSDVKLNLELTALNTELKEVVVEGERNTFQDRLTRPQMSVETLSSREAKLLPALFGEVDIIKTLQLKPGIQSGGEGTSGLFVRGGSNDQNLVLLEDALVYNPSHLFGFFSVFNPDAVRNVELYKGGFPAQFGGRLSSVLDVKMRDGNRKDYDVSGGLGLIASRLTVEGPIQKEKSSFLVSTRRTYVDVFTRMINKSQEDDPDWSPIPDYYFYDFNAKATFELGPSDRLFVNGYYGKDFFKFNDADFDFNFNWGNRVASARWAHQFSPRFFVNSTFSTSNYEYEIANKLDIFSFNLTSNITDYTLKTDFEYLPNDHHHVRFGASATEHQFTVGRLQASSDDGSVNVQAGNNYNGQEFGLYASDDWGLTPLLTVSYGVRVSGFRNDKTFVGLEPRASVNYRFTETLSLKANYTRMYQYVHLVSNSGASLPTDIWYPSSPGVKPQRSDQVALGVTKIYKEKYLLSTEAYYKDMKRQLDLKDGAQIFGNAELEEEFVFGTGESYGQEFYVEKKEGKTTGWIGYTLSWTNRTFPDINNGKKFPTRFDRRHDLSVVAIHELNKRISATATFVYGTGNAYSLPVQRFVFQDVNGEDYTVIPVYTERNSFRLAAYHRLDLGVVYKLRPKRGTSDLTFSVYNAYNRRNPYFVYFETIKDEETEQITGFVAKQVSLFPVIPSITYNFKF
ncbi:TonB-dependent receptor [Rufibacter sp. DG15C]|uniref:TonB-dependent receptor n=1 Tax=Rufibacter sp. DG15C TaxID=1379909 RepID=UPI00078BA21E|nr:TonB-dependent receptor [Rufibacter sp. DG15C]AMM50023.1 TonB-dependent receptor [Rufibacter sp. DG15C]